ncbi:hypothetical protein FKM82_013662 [Ascaphus truei]
MAPTTILLHSLSKEKHILRKPIVEKMRRDRINSSIEHLKLLMEKEFHKQEPTLKLEKADILEMAVSYLQQQKSQPSCLNSLEQDYKQGYSWCTKEALQFLCCYPESSEAQIKLLNHLQAPQKVKKDLEVCSASFSYLSSLTDRKQTVLTSITSKPWRPW